VTAPEIVHSMHESVVAKTKSVEFSVETASTVTSLWDAEAVTAPAFDKIFTRDTNLQVFKNNHELVTFSNEEARGSFI
jgi:hypothetical protein